MSVSLHGERFVTAAGARMTLRKPARRRLALEARTSASCCRSPEFPIPRSRATPPGSLRAGRQPLFHQCLAGKIAPDPPGGITEFGRGITPGCHPPRSRACRMVRQPLVTEPKPRPDAGSPPGGEHRFSRASRPPRAL